MIALDQLCPEIAPELQLVAAEVASIAGTGASSVSTAARSVVATPGKRLRPGLLLLAARACGQDGRRCIVPAAAVEILHAVSLVHDDVIDSADTRRGGPSARELWGNRMAVLLGDHLLAGALRRLAEYGDNALNIAIASVAMEMCRGQIQEIMSSGPELTEDHYLEIITAKTASLFAASARLGAVAAGAGPAELEALEAFGRGFGIAYQIADDIFDFTAAPEDTGKSAARDLAQGQITLPIIYSLREGSAAQRAELLAALDGAPARGLDLARVRRLVSDVGGFDYAASRVRHFADQAAERLSVLPQSRARDCLLRLTRDGLGRDRNPLAHPNPQP